jgi:hypothetical protein
MASSGRDHLHKLVRRGFSASDLHTARYLAQRERIQARDLISRLLVRAKHGHPSDDVLDTLAAWLRTSLTR